MIIFEDTRNKITKKDGRTFDKHKNIHDYCDQNNIKIYRTKLFVADYTLPTDQRVCIDTKQDIQELCSNVVQDHKRFRDELLRAADVGIKVIVLVEHGAGIRTLDDVPNWVNPRLKESPLAVSGERLYKILKAMEYTYNVRFEFCKKSETGQRIMELLTEGRNGK